MTAIVVSIGVMVVISAAIAVLMFTQGNPVVGAATAFLAAGLLAAMLRARRSG